MNVPASYLEGHRTKRLLIGPLTEKHTEHWKTFLKHPESTRYFPDVFRSHPDEQAVNWIQRQQERYRLHTFGLQALHLPDGTFIGQCGLLLQEIDKEQLLEVGYHLLPSYLGKGYATEAAAYFIDYARNTVQAPLIVSLIHPKNAPSRAVAGRNGLQYWKTSRWNQLTVDVFRKDFG